MELLGHADMKTTMIYLDISKETLRQLRGENRMFPIAQNNQWEMATQTGFFPA
jgi:site-specific recombinase XerC